MRVFLIAAGIVLAVAVIVYAIADIASIDRRRVRVFPKVFWAMLTIVLPVIGAMLWFTIGKAARPQAGSGQSVAAPENDPNFLKKLDERIAQDKKLRELEEELRKLEEEDLNSRPEGHRPGSSSTDDSGDNGGDARDQSGK